MSLATGNPVLDDAPAPAAAGPAAGSRRRSPWRTGLRRFVRHRAALVGTVVLLIVVIGAVFAPLISGYDPNAIDLAAHNAGPSGAHWLGTDSIGRDELSRLLYGGRISLGVGLTSAALAVVIGTLLGSLAGLLGGWVDGFVMRLADIFMSFPSLVVIVVIAGIIGPSVTTMIIGIGLFQWPVCARLVRGVTLSLREQEFVHASRATGAGPFWLMTRHIIPAALPPVSVVATLAVAQAIALEATLSFLGLGVQPPSASWGNMLTDAQDLTIIRTQPWLWLPPALAVSVTVLAVNFIGDGLRDAVDPRQS
jgi:ABC-type dipeptide/oligopeptide/nickel transport system permease subunit